MAKIYGSINNRLQEQCKGKTPVVGMGVTELLYTDRHPYEVIEVINDKKIRVRELDYKRTDGGGFSECQEYEYFSKPNGNEKVLVFRNGRWRDLQRDLVRLEDGTLGSVLTRKLGSSGWYVGEAERYFDPSF